LYVEGVVFSPFFLKGMKVDQSIISKCINGDQKSQFLLYDMCFSKLMGVCIRYKKDQGEAASILNVAFLKILSNLDKYKQSIPFEAWIKRITINTIIDDFRKNRKVKELIEYTDYRNYEAFKGHIAFNEADQLFDAEQLEMLIKKLPNMSQKVFNLFAIDGYSHKEISEMLSISVGTSKWHLSFARKKVQEMMQQYLESTKVIRYGK